jgi:DnaK suppressor protein
MTWGSIGPHSYNRRVRDSDIDKYRLQLEGLRSELQKQLSSSEDGAKPIAPDNAIGRLTRVDAMQSQQMAMALRQQNQLRLQRIDQALRFIENGRYGVCAKCGEEISESRLSVVPESVLCVKCAR